MRSLLAPGGDLLAVQFVLGPGVPEDAGPPWLLRRDEMESFAAHDVEQVALTRGPHPLRGHGPATWVGVFHRADGADRTV